jgi:Flp pilus assembly protein TadD
MNPRNPFDRTAILIVSVLLFCTPLAHSGTVSEPFGLPKSALVVAGALALLLAAILGSLVRGPGERLRLPAIYLAAAFLASCSVATSVSANRGLALRGLAEIMALCIVAWTVARSLREPQDAAWLFRSALAGAVVVAAGTIAQVYRPGFSLGFAGLSLLPPTPAGATLGDPGLAAQFLILALPLGIGAAALSAGVTRLLCGVGLGVVIAALLLASRPEGWVVGGGVLACLAATRVVRALRTGGVGGLLPDPKGEALRAAIVAGMVLTILVGLSYAPGFSSTGHSVAALGHVSLLAPTTGDPQADRAAAVRGSLALLSAHPLGVGPSFWRHGFLEVAWAKVAGSPFDLGHQAIHAGNSLLELAAETGVAGVIAFALLVLLLLVQAGWISLADPGPWGTVAFASLNTLLAAGLAAFYGSPFQETSPALLFWTVAGATQAARLRGTPPGGSRRLGSQEPGGSSAGPLRRVLAWAALGIWVVLLGAACVGLASRFDAGRRTIAAQGFLARGDLRQALSTLEAATIAHSPDHLPHVLRGDASLRSGDVTRAIEAFTATLERSPWFPAAYLGRAAAWESQGRYDKADDDLRRALAIWPDAPDLLLRRASLDAHRGRFEAALDGYRRLTLLRPNFAEAWCGLGEVYLRLEKSDAAMEALLTCMNRNPGFPGINLTLGEAYEKRGLDEMALGYFKRAATSDEKSVTPRLRLANLYNRMAQYCNARDALLAARDLEIDPQRRAAILDALDKVEPACSQEQQGKK